MEDSRDEGRIVRGGEESGEKGRRVVRREG